MKKYIAIGLLGLVISFTMSSCDFLDVVPDNVATLNNAFTRRHEAKKFLFTCYSFMPKTGNIHRDPAMLGGDGLWRIKSRQRKMMNIAKGLVSVVSPPAGFYWTQLYQGIRDCNIF